MQEGIEELQPTQLGILMSKHHLSLETMKRVARLAQSPSSTSYLLQVLACCEEMQQHPLRRSEKKRLNELNDSKVRYRVKGNSIKRVVNSTEMKINILLQAGIGRLLPKSDPLYAAMTEYMEPAQRILRGSFCLSLCVLQDRFRLINS